MRQETYPMNVVQGGTGAGTSLPAQHFIDKYVQVFGIAGGCTLQMQGTIDGTDYVKSGADIVADGVYEIPEAFVLLRVNRSATGTGNPTVTFSGRNERAA